ncbi:MAG: MFS transporter, partial [Spirochaetota bacterium]
GALIIFTGGLLLLGLHAAAIAVFVLLYILQNIRRPMSVGYVSQRISTRVMASGLSSESQLKTIFTAVLAPVMGFFADTMGVEGGLLAMAGILLMVFPFVVLRREQ